MKLTINFYAFENAFKTISPDNFSYEGLRVLFDHFEEYEESTGEQVELDVIGICCEHNEDTWQNIASDYRIELDPSNDDEANQKIVEGWLHDQGIFVGSVDGGFVYRCI